MPNKQNETINGIRDFIAIPFAILASIFSVLLVALITLIWIIFLISLFPAMLVGGKKTKGFIFDLTEATKESIQRINPRKK